MHMAYTYMHMHVCMYTYAICMYAYSICMYAYACTYGISYLYNMRMNTKYTCKYLALQFVAFTLWKRIVHYLTEQNGSDESIYSYVAM